jgi:hypothetical protein
VNKPADDREPDPLPLPDWPDAKQEAEDAPPPAPPGQGGGSVPAGEWASFAVRGGEIERQPQATVTFEAQNDTELLQRIDRNLDRIVELLRQIV